MLAGVGWCTHERYPSGSYLPSTGINILNGKTLKLTQKSRGKVEAASRRLYQRFNRLKLQKAVPRFEVGLLLSGVEKLVRLSCHWAGVDLLGLKFLLGSFDGFPSDVVVFSSRIPVCETDSLLSFFFFRHAVTAGEFNQTIQFI